MAKQQIASRKGIGDVSAKFAPQATES